MELKTLTVFTTTYNRAYCLHLGYDALKRQTSKDFIWLIIDDGSTDNTRELVYSWIFEGIVDISYYYKTNGGMHSGHNLAYELISTELNICIDSDDYMPDDAVEKILRFWKINQSPEYAGILGLDSYKDGSIVSSKKFPEHIKSGKYSELRSRYKLRGDIKFVYRTEVIKKYPSYPTFENEKFVPLNYKYLLIDQDYDILFFNEILCIVEYMQDGSTRNIINQYKKNPRGFAIERLVRMKYAYSFKERFFNSIHYVSCSLFLNNYSFLNESTNKVLTILAIPFGILLNLYIRFTKRKSII